MAFTLLPFCCWGSQISPGHSLLKRGTWLLLLVLHYWNLTFPLEMGIASRIEKCWLRGRLYFPLSKREIYKSPYNFRYLRWINSVTRGIPCIIFSTNLSNLQKGNGWLPCAYFRPVLCHGRPFALRSAGAHYHDSTGIITPSYCRLPGYRRGYGWYGVQSAHVNWPG